MIKAILFDCFGVLALDIWAAFCETLPPQTDFKALEALHLQLVKGSIRGPEFLKEVESLTSQHPNKFKMIHKSDKVKNTTLLEYITLLKAEGFFIGILSNVDNNWIRESLLTEQEAKLFDAIILSFETGMMKPDPGIYTYSCEQLGVEPNETLMVDDIAGYCEAAEHQGMQAIHYTSFEQFKNKIQQILYLK
ncbi:MAG: HAD family phosphatase [Candidatus Saccharimonadales bacterium]